MKTKFSFTLILTIFFTISVYSQFTTIANWNFENKNLQPSAGEGSLSFLGGVALNSLWDNTGINEGISVPMGIDETLAMKTGAGLQTFNYPAQGTGALTAGIRIDLNTSGYKDLVISFDVRHGGTSANKIVLKYTADGGVNWDKVATFTHDKDDRWYLCNFNFKNFPDAFNNPKFGICLVTNFDTVAYVPVKLTTPYDPTGPIRYDNIKFRGHSLSQAEDARTTLTNWNFENLSLQPSTGTGNMTVVGGLAVLWTKTGILTGSTIEDQGVYEIGKIESGFGMQTLNYPTQGTNSKKAGIQILKSTEGYKNILFEADVRYGNTSANLFTLQYTIDGTNWIDAANYTSNSGDTWYLRKYDFSSITAVNNNPLFGIRYVAALNPSLYVATGVADAKVYTTTGPVRFDNISIKADDLKVGTNDIKIQQLHTLRAGILSFNELPESEIRLISINGQCIFKISPKSTIDLNSMPSGIYILQYNNQVFKLIL